VNVAPNTQQLTNTAAAFFGTLGAPNEEIIQKIQQERPDGKEVVAIRKLPRGDLRLFLTGERTKAALLQDQSQDSRNASSVKPAAMSRRSLARQRRVGTVLESITRKTAPHGRSSSVLIEERDTQPGTTNAAFVEPPRSKAYKADTRRRLAFRNVQTQSLTSRRNAAGPQWSQRNGGSRQLQQPGGEPDQAGLRQFRSLMLDPNERYRLRMFSSLRLEHSAVNHNV
jgi:hypothetical protein